MVNRVPFLLSAVDAGPASLIEAASDTDLNDFFAQMFREFCLTLGETELANLSVPLALATQSQPADQHCLAHYPKDPTCEVCLQAKMCRAPAARKKQAVEDDKQTARVHGERIHCDLVGPTRPSINDEVYAMITHDDATGYPAARALRTKQASEAAAAFDDMYGNQSVSSVRTDNGGEFQGEFAAKLKERKIRHERSLPRRPQTNSRAERFHRTVAEGMACLFVASGVPYAFWTFCLMAFLFVYARSPGAGGADSPYQMRFNRSYDLSKLRPFGSACYYLSEEHEKFASRGRLGVVLGYSRLQSYYVLDFEHYVETKGEARIVHTRDVRFPPQVRWPFHELGMDNPDAAYWAQRLFEPEVLQPTPVAGDDGRCVLCGLWATDADIHCRGCLLGGGRRRHVDGPGCLRARCGGHAFLDVQPPPDSPETSMDYSPSTPRSRDGGVIDSSMDSSSSRFSTSHDAHDDDDMGPPPDDEGDGRCHTDASPRRPRWRVGLFADAQMPPEHNYGPHFDDSMDSGLVPPRPDLAPSTPLSNRVAADLTSSSGRSRSHRGSHPSDADSERASQSPDVAQNPVSSSSPSQVGSHPSDADSERSRPASSSHNRTSTELRPDAIHSSDADSERSQQPTNDRDNAAISSTVTFESDRSGLSTVVRGGTVLTTPAALRLEQELDKLTTELGKMFACVTKIVKRRDPEWDTNAAREAIRKEAANHASKRTWESEACEWETAVAKYGPDVEYVQANLILGIKHYELDQSQHRFKARIVALGDNVRDIYGRLVEEDQLHGRPITLEGSRALDCYAGLQPDGDCQTADADGAYLQARLKGRPKVICLPREFRTQSELEMRCPVHLLYMAIYGLTRSNSDWEDHADDRLLLKHWLQARDIERPIFKKEYNGHIVGMGRFVDDFKLAGHKPVLPHAWAEIFECFDFADPPQPVSRFVGSEEILSRDQADVATFLVKQDAYIDTLTRKYMDEIGAYRLPRYDTPAVKLATNDVSNMSETGQFASNCGSYVGAGLWVARNSRPEISFAVGWLGRYTTKWTRRQDAALHRLMGYLAATRSSALRLVLNPADVHQRTLKLVLWVDSDWATDPDTRRSTSGAVLQLVGSHGTRATFAWRSHRQGATALSAPDAEVTAMAEGLKRHGIYAQDLFEFLLGYRVPLDIMTDSATGIAAIDDAYGVLKYMKRTQGVPLSWLHDVSMDPDNNINKTSTDDNLADVMTKALEKNKFQHFSRLLGVHPHG
ncbi:RE1 [Symbiodinium sp. CCMP2592]|nr:RE1 [Symbiodinium sp. CCMP2592]